MTIDTYTFNVYIINIYYHSIYQTTTTTAGKTAESRYIMKTVWTSKYFCGNKITDVELNAGYISYCTLAKSFNSILNNELINIESDYWEEINGTYYDDETEEYKEYFQWFIIDNDGVDILTSYTNELVVYNDRLDVYLWGIDHYGTNWKYVSTDIKIDLESEVN